MSTQQPISPPHENDGAVRKRVCKACDRCRLKKSKCDGLVPCTRCRSDNSICVFGERKKSHDKVYPKGYVEMLEQNHAQLVNGIQELYARAVSGQAWVGPPLKTQSNGHPHIHDILERLGALKGDSRSGSEAFEEDLHVLQQNLFASGAGLMHPHDSVDNSDTEQTRPAFSGVETMPARPFFTAPFGPSSGLPTPPMQTPSGRLSLQIPAEAQFRQQPSYECQSRGSCPQANMNPTGLHRQSWPRPVPTEESLEFLRYAMPAYDNARPQQFSQTPADLRALSPMAVPVDWIEDDFSTYLQPSLS